MVSNFQLAKVAVIAGISLNLGFYFIYFVEIQPSFQAFFTKDTTTKATKNNIGMNASTTPKVF